MGVAPGYEVLQSCWIVAHHRGLDRWSVAERLAPTGDLGLAGKDAEFPDRIEDIEIAEYRSIGCIDQMESVAVEPGIGRQPLFKTLETLGQRFTLFVEGLPV